MDAEPVKLAEIASAVEASFACGSTEGSRPIGSRVKRLAQEAWNPLFVEALQKKAHTEYLLDILLSGSMEERACVVAEYGKEVRKIEQRISEFTASHPASRHERSRSLSAGAER